MPDIDRDALNRALAEKLEACDRADLAYQPWTTCPECKQDDIRQPADCPRCGAEMERTPRPFCTNLNAAVDALNALGLSYTPVVEHVIAHITVEIPRLGAYETRYATDTTPAALATALVRAALKVLGEEETDA